MTKEHLLHFAMHFECVCMMQYRMNARAHTHSSYYGVDVKYVLRWIAGLFSGFL